MPAGMVSGGLGVLVINQVQYGQELCRGWTRMYEAMHLIQMI